MGLGFTLLEVLLSISLLALLMSLAYGSFSQLARQSESLTHNLQARQKLRLLLYVVAEDLRNARYLEQFVAAEQESGIEAGQSPSEGKLFSWVHMHVVGPSRLHRNANARHDPQVHEASYAIKRKGDVLALLRREGYYVDDTLTRGGVEQVLAEGIKEFALEYLPLRADETRGWLSEWKSASRPSNSRMPVAIRLTMGIEQANGKVLKDQISFNLLQTLYGTPPAATQ